MKPMLAHDYEKQGHKITYPAFIQPKLDGIRCVAVKSRSHVDLYFRSGDLIMSVPHINAALTKLMTNGDVLDGELYNHEAGFDKLSGDIRSKDGRGNDYVEFHVYDHPIVLGDKGYSQHERVTQLKQYRDNDQLTGCLQFVDTYMVEDEEHMKRGLEYYMSKGYEGVMVRSVDGTYESKRSFHLQKVKKFYEEEYEIIDIIEGKGKLQGHVGSFVCKIGEDTFKAKMGGDQSELERLFENPGECIGKFLTVKYQEKTKAGKPRFPTGKGIRYDK